MDMQVVYVEAVLMPNKEVLHYGKSLGFVNARQFELAQNGASKITKGGETVVAISPNVA